MRSDYQKWLTRDVQPEEAAPKLTGAAWWKNWWHYNWRIVLAAVVGVVLLWQIAAGLLGIGQTEPDYQIAYVGSTELPQDTVDALTGAIAAMGEDENGDGQVFVSLHQYVMSDAEESVESSYAAFVQLSADLAGGESYFWLLEDPDEFQQDYAALALLDGSCPEEDDSDGMGKVYRWADCPALAGLDLGSYTESVLGQTVTGDNQELLSGLFLGRRCFYPGSGITAENPDGCAALWDALTAGASQ